MIDPTDLLQAIADCLCETIKSSKVDDVCFCGVVFGGSVVADYIGGCGKARVGMAYVRMVAMYPASGVNEVNETVNHCDAGLGMDLEVGMLRPMALVTDSRGKPPTPEQYLAASATATGDASVMLRAIRCCETLNDLDTIMGAYTPAGPDGGVIGGTWPLAVMLD